MKDATEAARAFREHMEFDLLGGPMFAARDDEQLERIAATFEKELSALLSAREAELRAERDALQKEHDRRDVMQCPSWSYERDLVEVFSHMGYADGDAGYLMRYVSYGEADHIKRAIQSEAKLDAALAQVAALREALDDLLAVARENPHTMEFDVCLCPWCEARKHLADTAAAAQAFVERIRAEEREACAKALDDPALLEVLADAEHQRWASWMRYQQTAPPETRADWPRKVALVYWGMTEAEKESDRVEARKTLAIILNRIRARAQGGD